MANIPSPIVQPQSRPGFGRELLSMLAQTAAQGAAQYGLAKLEQPLVMERGAQQAASAANVAEINQQGRVAAALAVEQAKIKAAEDSKAKLRELFLSSVRKRDPGQESIAALVWDSNPGNVSSSALVESSLLPPTTLRIAQEAEAEAQTAVAKANLRRLNSDAALGREFADKLGIKAGTVPDAVITDLLKSGNPSQLYENVLTNLVSRTVVDPAGNPLPAFDPEEAALRAEAAVGTIIPNYKANITPAARSRGVAGGIVAAAVAREKLANPRVKPEELRKRLQALFNADLPQFPGLTEADFDGIFVKAMKANLLTGM